MKASYSRISDPQHRLKLSSELTQDCFGGQKQCLLKMAHAKSLRVIGQALEVAKVATFELENDGQSYDVRSDSLTQTGEWILQNALSENKFSERRTRSPTVKRSLRFQSTRYFTA